MIDNITITVLVVLSFLLVWLGIMIFTTKPEEEEEAQEEAIQPQQQQLPQQQTQQQVVMAASNSEDVVTKYERVVAELENKIRMLEARPTSDKLLDWLTDLRRENEFLKARLAQMGSMNVSYPVENDRMKELEEYKEKIKKLENEIEELKDNLTYYRTMMNRLQGRYTVLNKYNYRMCIRNPETGEYQYELVKLPHDFDPFNPTYITRDGMEVYEEYGIRIPTKLGDIIREEFKKDLYMRDFELGR
ncbi:MAG: hypothetical protein J7K61_03585 [Thermoplasmata archaeon]|nr:hypothetical protein [Thermoplasmata archaeon]